MHFTLSSKLLIDCPFMLFWANLGNQNGTTITICNFSGVFYRFWSTWFDANRSSGYKVKVLPVPAFGYSPETKSYIGAVCLINLNFYQDCFTRSSNAKIEFNYSWYKQVILETDWNYFYKHENWFTQWLVIFLEISW